MTLYVPEPESLYEGHAKYRDKYRPDYPGSANFSLYYYAMAGAALTEFFAAVREFEAYRRGLADAYDPAFRWRLR